MQSPPMKSRITLRIGKMLEALTAPVEHERSKREREKKHGREMAGCRREERGQHTGVGVLWMDQSRGCLAILGRREREQATGQLTALQGLISTWRTKLQCLTSPLGPCVTWPLLISSFTSMFPPVQPQKSSQVTLLHDYEF